LNGLLLLPGGMTGLPVRLLRADCTPCTIFQLCLLLLPAACVPASALLLLLLLLVGLAVVGRPAAALAATTCS
jgi:hypothetical protein